MTSLYHRRLRRAGTSALLGLALLARAVAVQAAAQPSQSAATYVLFAGHDTHINRATIVDGNVGANDLLYLRGDVLAPNSDFAASTTRLDVGAVCRDLFTTIVLGVPSPTCPKKPAALPSPLISSTDVRCVTRPDFPACNPAKGDNCAPRTIGHNQILFLPPGHYGDLTVEGGGPGTATLYLGDTKPGAVNEYSFLSVRVGRGSKILFRAPSSVYVTGSVRLNTGADIGAGAPAVAPGAIKWFVNGGEVVRFSRAVTAQMHLSAPCSKMSASTGTTLTGHFVASSIRVRRAKTITFSDPVPAVCGDGLTSPGEDCETTAECGMGKACVACKCQATTCQTDANCNGGSTSGGFVCEDGHCTPRCHQDSDCSSAGGGFVSSTGGGFVCEDGHCVPGCQQDADCSSAGAGFVCENHHCVPGCQQDTDCSSAGAGFVCQNDHCVPSCHEDADCSSAGAGFLCENGHCVPPPTSTTTTTLHTTTTTLHHCATDADCPVGVCQQNVCQPQCQNDGDCNQGSPGGGFVCQNGRCGGPAEDCGDCIDNDGDGLVDFEDPDCCAAPAQLFAMDLHKGRFRAHATGGTALRLNGMLARSGLVGRIHPATDAVTIQIASADHAEILCARIPAGDLRQKKHLRFVFSQKRDALPEAIGRNLDRVVVKLLKDGSVRYRVKGKRASLVAPVEGAITVTVGFNPQTVTTDNVCSQAVRVFRKGKKGRLRYP